MGLGPKRFNWPHFAAAELGRIEIEQGFGWHITNQLFAPQTHDPHRDRPAPAAARIIWSGPVVLADKPDGPRGEVSTRRSDAQEWCVPMGWLDRPFSWQTNENQRSSGRVPSRLGPIFARSRRALSISPLSQAPDKKKFKICSRYQRSTIQPERPRPFSSTRNVVRRHLREVK